MVGKSKGKSITKPILVFFIVLVFGSIFVFGILPELSNGTITQPKFEVKGQVKVEIPFFGSTDVRLSIQNVSVRPSILPFSLTQSQQLYCILGFCSGNRMVVNIGGKEWNGGSWSVDPVTKPTLVREFSISGLTAGNYTIVATLFDLEEEVDATVSFPITVG